MDPIRKSVRPASTQGLFNNSDFVLASNIPLESFYSKFSPMFMNCLVAFVGVNLLLLVVFAISDQMRLTIPPDLKRFGYGALQQDPGSSPRWTGNESEMLA